MKLDDIRELQTATPFKPFKIHLTDGSFYDVKHPQGVMVLRYRILVGVVNGPNDQDGVYDLVDNCSCSNIVRVE